VVQTNMTNSRLTDPEILEFRFPVRLESYEIRHGSGGAGRWHGGNGGVRKVRFLEPMTAAILSNNRIHAPFGMAGGEPGALGVNTVMRADGRVEQLGHIGKTDMAARRYVRHRDAGRVRSWITPTTSKPGTRNRCQTRPPRLSTFIRMRCLHGWRQAPRPFRLAR
jgi:N-methylhydantoinase B/oxoprolinase/acetone carboxylase alpha subunit